MILKSNPKVSINFIMGPYRKVDFSSPLLTNIEVEFMVIIIEISKTFTNAKGDFFF